MKIHKRINGGQYPIRFDVFLGYGNADKEAIYKKICKGARRANVRRLFDTIQNTDIDSKAGWHIGYNGHYVVIMHLFNADIPKYYGTFQHELHHCVKASGRHLAFPVSEATEEYYAYLTGYITELVYKRIWG